MAIIRDPYHAPGTSDRDVVEPRNPEAVAAEAEYQRWHALVMAKDTDAVIALHNELLAAAIPYEGPSDV